MKTATKTLLAVAAGAVAIAAAASMGTAALAMTLGLVAIGAGGLMAGGIIDPLNDIVRPAAAWASRTAQKGLYFVRDTVKGWFSPKPAEEAHQHIPPSMREPMTAPGLEEPNAPPPRTPLAGVRGPGWER